jgi:glycosyltransferase involved in cell wall biosynthesis
VSRPLRILHLLSAPAAGGAEIYVKLLALELRRMGHEPSIGFLSRAADDGRNPEFERKFLAELDDAGIDHFFVGKGARANPLLGALRVARYCRKRRIDLYHSHLKYGVAFGLLLRIPRITTHHNFIAESPRWMFRFFNLLVDQYVAVSTTCAVSLEQFTHRRAVTIRNAIDLSHFTPTVRQPLSGGALECLCVGRIFEQKNYPLLVCALGLLPRETLSKLHVSIAGEGPPDEVAKLERQIAAAGLGNRVTLLGLRSDIPELLATAHLFLMSSAWEGLPIALLEATASGLPFIATDVGGCRELADSFGNGIIVPPGDAQALAAAITELANNPELIVALSKAAIEARSSISIEAAALEHVAIYEQLVSG